MDTYIYFYISCVSVFITVTFQLLPENEYVHSGCYGNLFSSLMDANCSFGEVIAPIELRVGSKTNDSGCPAVAQTDFTAEEFQRCCQPNNDGCVGIYQTYGNNSNPYKDDCVGRTQCSSRQVAFMDTLHLGCNQSVYLPQTNFMFMNYYCISRSKIGILPTVRLQSDTVGSFLYLQGQSYPSEIMTSSIVCSVETQCENTITIYAVDIRLNSSSGSCNQKIDITDGVTNKSIACNDNNDFVIKALYTSQKNYLVLSFNSSISTGGFFWIGITASNGNVTLNCPLQNEIYQCETTTEEQTTTTTREITTSAITSVETTASDITAIENTETTSITVDNSEVTKNESRIQTSTTNKPGASQSAEDKRTIIVVSTVCSAVVLAIPAAILYCYIKKKKKNLIENKKPDEKESQNINDIQLKNNDVFFQGNRGVPTLPPLPNESRSITYNDNKRKKKKRRRRRNTTKEADDKTTIP